MRFLIHYSLILFTISTSIAQQNVYLLKIDNGHLKKLKSETILTFKTSDSTWVTGRIGAVTDSSFTLLTYKKNIAPDTINVLIKSVSQVTNKLIDKPATVAGIIGYVGIIGIVSSPFTLIANPPEDALSLLEASAALVATSAIIYSPHLLKRKFNMDNKWALVTK